MSQERYRLRNQIRGVESPAAVDSGAMGSMFFNASKLQHINHGRFWRAGISYSHCFWEAYIKPSSSQSSAGYFIADTQGGAHCLLWGVQPSSATHYTITGNMHDGTNLTSFGLTEILPFDHWIHVAVGWDGSHILHWIDGILAYKQAYSPAQRKNPGGNDQTLHVGGSDHNNFWGNIAWIRGYEGYGRCREDSDFLPELFLRPMHFQSGLFSDTPQFAVSYQQPSGIFTDHGKFEGISHPGIVEAVQGTGYQTGRFVGTSLTLPQWEADDITLGTYVPTPPATPSGAIVWDSFSRVNCTPANPANFTSGIYTLGSTEAGSAGVRTWREIGGAAEAGGAGTLFGRAYIVNQATDKVVDTGTLTQDVRVNRLPTNFHYTGVIVRCKDANDYYKIVATDTQITVTKIEGGASSSVGYTPTSGWTTLRVTASGTTMSVYVGDATEGTFTLQGSFDCTNVAGATYAGIARPVGVKTPVYFDNFLVK